MLNVGSRRRRLLKRCQRNYRKARREIFASWIAANIILAWKRGTSSVVSKRRALCQSRSRYTFRNSQILSARRASLNIISLSAPEIILSATWRDLDVADVWIPMISVLNAWVNLCIYICLKITLERVERNARKCERKTGRYDGRVEASEALMAGISKSSFLTLVYEVTRGIQNWS